MFIARVLAMLAKPALLGGAVAAAGAGGIIAYDRWRDASPTPFQAIQSRGQQLLISEFGERSDTIVALDPGDPSGSRTTIAEIDHAPGYGVFATLSPDGEALAYTALPANLDEPAPDAPALAGIVGVDGDTEVLADDVDLLVPPVWTPDSGSIVVRKNTPAEDSAGSFELILLGRDGSRSTITSWRSAAVFPIGFTGSTLYFATLNTSGSDLYRVGADGSDETLVAHLADGIARDWRLSPDGAAIAYSVTNPGEQSVKTLRVDVATGVVAEAVASSDGARQEFNPAWRNDGTLTIASVDDSGGDTVSIDGGGGATAQLSDNDDSIDLPLGWSPDGATLAVRAVDGPNAHSAGASRVELLDAGGGRVAVSDSPDVLIVGWLE
jgi:hypothetical protein